MTPLKKKIIENGIHYTLHGDYYFPDLEFPKTPQQGIGRYGRMRKTYLEKHRPGLYERLILSGKLYEHLAEIDTCCADRMDRMLLFVNLHLSFFQARLFHAFFFFPEMIRAKIFKLS